MTDTSYSNTFVRKNLLTVKLYQYIGYKCIPVNSTVLICTVAIESKLKKKTCTVQCTVHDKCKENRTIRLVNLASLHEI